MSGFTLRSYAFRKERERGWRALEELVEKADHKGLQALDAAELHRLPALYRSTLSALSVARAISLDRNVVAYLESLAARAYVQVYGCKRRYRAALAAFFVRRFPALVWRHRRALGLAILALALGVLCGFALVWRDAETFYGLVPEGLAQGRTPATSRARLEGILAGGGDGGLSLFASALFSHNARIGMLAFTLGIAAGVPVVLLLFRNGLILGAFAAIHARHELSIAFWAWVLPHGLTELLALSLCGAAGLILGGAVIVPGRYGRLAELARRGREAAALVLGAVFLFFVAALIEGYFRQLITDVLLRYLLAALSVGAWTLYFGFLGERAAAEAADDSLSTP